MNNKMQEFRKRAQKEANLNAQKNTQDIQQMFKMVLGLAGKVYNIERKFNALFPVAKIADWRSLAIMKLLDEAVDQNGVKLLSEERVIQKAEQLQIESFDHENVEDDKARGLVSADDEVAAKEHFAIATMNVYLKGVELEDQRVVRTKIQIGHAELFPELDEVLVGMKVGEKKRFPLNLQDKSDEAEVTLLGLRKSPAKFDKAMPTEGTANEAQAPGQGS